MGRPGRTGPAGSIGAGGGNVASAGLNQGQSDGMVRHTNRHCIQSSGGSIRHFRTFSENHGQGPRPESVSQFSGAVRYLLRDPLQVREPGDMYNQRIVRRPALGCVNFGRGGFIQSVGSQPVHRLRGKGHQAALPDNLPAFAIISPSIPWVISAMIVSIASFLLCFFLPREGKQPLSRPLGRSFLPRLVRFES